MNRLTLEAKDSSRNGTVFPQTQNSLAFVLSGSDVIEGLNLGARWSWRCSFVMQGVALGVYFLVPIEQGVFGDGGALRHRGLYTPPDAHGLFSCQKKVPPIDR
jgi:hypothetical protein